MSMHADEESDEGIVPMKRSNNEDLDAYENEPTCGQSSGPTECGGMIRCDMREQGRKRNALQI
jgi:hypothetical protein